jgi:ribosomal protein S13
MTAAEVRDEISSGKTMQEIFAEKGLDYETYLEQWLADHEACLADAVAEGKLTEDQAELLQERLEDRVDDGLFFYQNQGFADSMRSYMRFRAEKIWEGGHGLIGQILEKLEITFDDLKVRITGGETLEEIAEEAGIDLDAKHDEFIQKQLENVEQALADGKITEAQADRIRERLNDQLENPIPWKMFDRMRDRMDKPFDMFRDGGRPGGMGQSRGNSSGR